MNDKSQSSISTITTAHVPVVRAWTLRSVAILTLAWLILQIGGLFTPGLLDDVDSIYIEIAREMLQRHDFITPYVNGVRFFDKPPLLYWMAAGSMSIFGIHDWAARLPLALSVLALLLATYALGIRLFRTAAPASSPDRGGFYAALALATSIGPYLYTRFYIPDILLALWMTLAVHLFLIALDRLQTINPTRPSLIPCLAFAAVMALNVLTKGLIGLVFPIAFVLLYLAFTKQLRLLSRLHPIAGTAVFLAIAAPWHILAALRNPPIALPSGVELPARGGWAWFYLYNEHIARFLGKRVPHDYGLTPVWLFWLYLAIWIMPWATFIPGAISQLWRSRPFVLRGWMPHLRGGLIADKMGNRVSDPPSTDSIANSMERQGALSLLLWIVVVLGFFSLSSRQEYYSLPAIPALALMAGVLLARADRNDPRAFRSALAWSRWLLLPLTSIVAIVCAYFAITAPHPAPETDIASLLAQNPELYNLSLGHLFDLTGAAMGLFRGPLAATAIGMLTLGLGSYLLRRRKLNYAANLTLAAGMIVVLLAAHEGLVRFNPILGSRTLAVAINREQATHPKLDDLILLDGELTSGSTLIFYTGQQIHVVNGRVNGLWYGSFWPDAPRIFETDATLHQLWSGSRRIFLLTYNPTARAEDLAPYGNVRTLATAGGKTILTNH